MEWNIRRREDGQVLVQVALMIFVLLLFVGLAVDVGNVYGERRHMQNAADAGALAGAREICFGDPAPANVVGQAERYAIDENGAQDAEVEIIEGYKVHVVARVAAETYFIRLIPGLETIDVSAEAEAACTSANSICGMWPIAFDVVTWNTLKESCPEDPEEADVGQEFFVWVDDNRDMEELGELCGERLNGQSPCNCDPRAEEGAFGGHPMGKGSRGWLRLSEPEEWPYYLPEYNPGDCGGNCGQALKCWLEWLYSGPIGIGDCVPGKPGVDTAALQEAEDFIDDPDKPDNVNVLLYDDTSCDGLPIEGDCEGDLYHVAGFGCVKVLRVYHGPDALTWPPNEDYPWELEEKYKPNDCPNNEKVLLVAVACDCDPSECGSGAGGPVLPGEVGAVSLIK